MRFDRVVQGGNVVTPGGSFTGDIGIRGEKIVALGVDLDAAGAEVTDARGHHVIPGVLDVHVHLELPFCGTVSADDYRTGTRAGARSRAIVVGRHRAAEGELQVDVYVEHAGNHMVPPRVGHLGARRVEVHAERYDLLAPDADVAREAPAGSDDVAALYHSIESHFRWVVWRSVVSCSHTGDRTSSRRPGPDQAQVRSALTPLSGVRPG